MSKGHFSKNIIIVLVSNSVMVLLGVIISFVLPKIIDDVESYGYWQLYYFYSGYYGLFLFGFNDGMNLLFAGKKYEDLEKSRFSAYFIYVVASTAILAIATSLIVGLLIPDVSMRNIVVAVLINILVLNVTGFTLHINQISMRFGNYSRINIMERLLFALMLAPVWLFGVKAFMIYMLLNLAIRVVVMLYGIFTVRDLLEVSKMGFKNVFSYRKEIIGNIKVGLPLTFGTILAMLIVTSSRIVVEKTQTIYNYGLFSLAFATLSLVVTVISALSTVLYPSLRMVKAKQYPILNSDIKFVVTMVCMLALSVYYIVPGFVRLYLPKYAGIEEYLYLLFPWIIYQSIGSIVNDVFFRLARLERRIFLHNAIGLALVIGMQFAMMLLTKRIDATILSGLIAVAAWAHLNDIYLHHIKEWKMQLSSYIDVPIIIIFLIITRNFGAYIGFCIYVSFCAILILMFRKRLRSIFHRLRRLELTDDSALAEIQ